jgi:SAM-dependent methyltransferase
MSDNDTTFRNYAPAAAAQYAALRPGYPEKVINTIIEVHNSTGGQMDLLLDVGCGPGTATRSLAPFFQHAFGTDPGESMIEAAQQNAPQAAGGERTKFVVCAAEDLTSISEIRPGTVDLISAGTAAHWFNLPAFYASAAKMLRPGGTIALWCTGSLYCDPYSTPNAAKVQQVFSDVNREILGPFELPQNKLYRELYQDLELPWTIKDSDPTIQAAMAAFDQSKFKRVEFNKNGELEPGQKYVQSMTSSLKMLQYGLGTTSGVNRWREAHKEQLERGEIEDCAAYMIRRVKEVMAQVPEGEGRDWIEGGSPIGMIFLKMKDVDAGAMGF